MQVKILNANEINYAKLSELMHAAFAPKKETFEGARQIEMISEERLRQKYMTSPADSFCAIVQVGEKYVASNGLLGFHICVGNEVKPAWMSCDTSTDPSYRGKGYFKSCLSELQNKFKDDILIGFPNSNSIKGFKNLGWKRIVKYNIQARPVLKIRKDRKFIERNFPEIRSFQLSTNGIVKNVEYLNWRYPSIDPRYSRIAFKSKKIEYFMILETYIIHDIKTTLVLEFFWGNNISYFHGMRDAIKFARHNSSKFIVNTSANGIQTLSDTCLGFFRIPRFIADRRIDLLAINYSQDERATWDGRLGDWDAL